VVVVDVPDSGVTAVAATPPTADEPLIRETVKVVSGPNPDPVTVTNWPATRPVLADGVIEAAVIVAVDDAELERESVTVIVPELAAVVLVLLGVASCGS
jgi:hypothetical protein